jgi:hypothetical protein
VFSEQKEVSNGLMIGITEKIYHHLNTSLLLKMQILESQLTKHMLDHVVSVLVLDELLDIRVQLLENGHRLVGGAVFENALDHPAAVRVCGQRVHLKSTPKFRQRQNQPHYPNQQRRKLSVLRENRSTRG